MIDVTKMYADFLGIWDLDAATCVYEQSDPPSSGSYTISESKHGLTFRMAWTDTDGEQHVHSFSCMPDGQPKPFNGGELADAISVTAVSPVELNSAAFYQGRQLMTAARTLKDGGIVMEVRQSVLLPDGTQPTNFACYRRRPGS